MLKVNKIFVQFVRKQLGIETSGFPCKFVTFRSQIATMTSTTAVVDMESWGEYMYVQEIPPWPIKFSLQRSGTQIVITRFLAHLLSLLVKHREENQKRQIFS